MEKVIIVDKKDNPIGLKERDLVDPKKDIIRISVLWVTNFRDQILLAQRAMNKIYCPGAWAPAVGGTNEEGETYESNIYKEAEEEIGLKDIKFSLGPKFFVPEPNNKFCQVFLLKLDRPLDQFKIQGDEIIQIKWFDKDELRSKLRSSPDDFTPVVHKMMKNK